MLKILFGLLFWWSSLTAGGVILYEWRGCWYSIYQSGMTRFKSPEFVFGAQPLYIHLEFDADRQTTGQGSDGDASSWIPAGGSFYVMPTNERLSIGGGAACQLTDSL